MFAETTCFLTADRHWIRMDELAKHPVIPLMCWRRGNFRYTLREYTVKVVEKSAMCYRMGNVYQIDMVMTWYHKVPTERGLVSVSALTPDDEMYLYLDGRLIKCRPRTLVRAGHRRVYHIATPDAFALIARDVDSRWKNAFDIGVLVRDKRGSTKYSEKTSHQMLP